MKHKELPLAELTLRKYEKPYRLSGRELVRKLCLSLGLLQPGDGRDVVVDVVYALLAAKEPLSLDELAKSAYFSRKNAGATGGLALSNIRRQIRRLRECFLVERVGNAYCLAENASLHEIFQERIEKFYLPTIVSRVKEYCEAVEKERCKYGMSEMPK